MKRRDFFKVITGFVAGIFATSAKSKEDFPIPADPLKDKFVLNHMQRLCIEASTGIDPNSDWAKQELLTLADIRKAAEALDAEETNRFIFYETNRLIDPTREYFKVAAKELPPLLQKNIDDTIIKVFD